MLLFNRTKHIFVLVQNRAQMINASVIRESLAVKGYDVSIIILQGKYFVHCVTKAIFIIERK